MAGGGAEVFVGGWDDYFGIFWGKGKYLVFLWQL
jgi:hypothetical protein